MKDTTPNSPQPQNQHKVQTVHSVAQEARDAAAKPRDTGESALDEMLKALGPAAEAFGGMRDDLEVEESLARWKEMYAGLSMANRFSGSSPPQVESPSLKTETAEAMRVSRMKTGQAGDATVIADNPGKTAPAAESTFEHAANFVRSERGKAESVGSIGKAGEKHGSQANQSPGSPPHQGAEQVPSLRAEIDKVLRNYRLMTNQATDEDKRLAGGRPVEKPRDPGDTALAAVQKAFGTAGDVELIERDDVKIPGPLRRAWDKYQGKWTEHGMTSKVVGVHCGKGLAALVFENLKDLEEFASRNPWAAGSLVTTCLCGFALWFQAAGGVPEGQSLIGIEVVSSGDVPVTRQDSEPAMFLVRAGPVPAVDFQKIHWDEQNKGVLRFRAMEAIFGRAYQRVGKRKRILNEAFWGRWLSSELGLIYDTHASQFYHAPRNDSSLQPLNQSQVLSLVSLSLQELARRVGSVFPREELRLPRIRRIVDSIKVASAVTPPTDHETLSTYVAGRIRTRPGSSLSVEEIYQDCKDRSAKKKQRVVPLCFFSRELPRLIRERFAVTQVHNVKRPREDGKLTARRGFNGLGFADDESSDIPDSKDNSDMAAGSAVQSASR
jgi:hypothetical protein